MKTTTTTTTTTTTKTKTAALADANGYLTAAGKAEEARYIRAALSDAAVYAISEYEVILAGILACGTAEGNADYPGFDAALRHALQVATKASRAELKAAQGKWALRQLKAERRATGRPLRWSSAR